MPNPPPYPVLPPLPLPLLPQESIRRRRRTSVYCPLTAQFIVTYSDGINIELN